MGLDTTHDAWHGSYGSFAAWREWLANQKGFELKGMCGFGGNKMFDTNDPLTPLLDHSDCDGEIKWEDCKGIADSLRAILDSDPDDNVPEGYPDGYFVMKTEEFILGCINAWQEQENIEFG